MGKATFSDGQMSSMVYEYNGNKFTLAGQAANSMVVDFQLDINSSGWDTWLEEAEQIQARQNPLIPITTP